MAAEAREGALDTELVTRNPRDLKLLELNARFMRHETYQRLVENIRQDGVLTSVPMVCLENGKEVVRSGNHRVKAAIDAGLEEITVLLVKTELDRSRLIAMQLSHNELSGEDDPAILAQLYEMIEDVDWRQYSGLDDKKLDLLESVGLEALSEANLDFQTISIVFLPHEVDRVKETFEAANALLSSDEAWLSRWKEYDRVLDALEEAGAAHGVTNIASALMIVIDVFERSREMLSEGWYDSEEKVAKHKHWVPLSTVIGVTNIPADSAAIIKQALDKAIGSEDVTPQAQWKLFELLAADYLAGQ